MSIGNDARAGQRPVLSRALLADGAWVAPTSLHLPTPAQLALPERALQFGTGAFLRGFVDFFLDAANAQGLFNGRVVLVGSTGSGRDRALQQQDGLYTLVARGMVDGALVEDTRVIGAVSRALSATNQWDDVLEVARSPELTVIFSNTTEVGIAISDGDVRDDRPPRSFPARLTACLYERARAFDFDPARGVVVVPCELIEDNGATLRTLVRQLAERWQLGPEFTRWLDTAVPFCNTLVDRIVPGAPSGDDAASLPAALGYDDAMLTTAEHFRQFVIEGDAALAARLGFTSADPGIMVVPDVRPYRERKVRLLNGAHTIAVSTALLCGCDTVHDAMSHQQVGTFLRRTLLDEIVPSLDVPDAEPFAHAVLQRFANPSIRHALVDITLQGTSKFRVRLLPTFERAAARLGHVPQVLAFGFAAHLLYLRGDLQGQRRDAGLRVPPDAAGEGIQAIWAAGASPERLVSQVCADSSLWGTSLADLPGFAKSVTGHLIRMLDAGVPAALLQLITTEAA